MMIKKLDATFGKLEGESLELHDGLNVISAPNESGKSTWCAFVRAMLYGVDSSERQKAGFLPDKMRFAPFFGILSQNRVRGKGRRGKLKEERGKWGIFEGTGVNGRRGEGTPPYGV